MSWVALVRGNDRYQNVRKALELIKEDVGRAIAGKRRILIKPNFVSTRIPLSATHVDAVRATMRFLSEEFGVNRFLVAEGPAAAPAFEGFSNYGYLDLAREFDVEFLDLNLDDYVEVEVFDENLRPMTVRVSKTALESDFRVSITPLKTHDTVVITLSLKNLVVGSLIDHDKSKIHQGYRAINLSLFKLAEILHPQLSVIDGFVAMEGDGPLYGDPVDLRIAIASTDWLAADALACWVAGFDPHQVGYLYYATKAGLGEGELSRIRVVGEDPAAVRRRLRPHTTFHEQLRWRMPSEELRRIDGRLA